MAENDNTGGSAPGEDRMVAIATSLFEGRLAIEATRIGIETLGIKHPALKSDAEVVLGFAKQAAEAFEAVTLQLAEMLPIRGLQA